MLNFPVERYKSFGNLLQAIFSASFVCVVYKALELIGFDEVFNGRPVVIVKLPALFF